MNDPGEVSEDWRRWLRHRYDAEGPVPKEIIDRDARAHLLAVVSDAVAAVLADIDRTRSYTPTVVVEEHDGFLCVVVDESWSGLSLSIERSGALVEIADYFQEQLEDQLGCWPECKAHEAGLHPEVRSGAAVWWCRRGDHAVSLIGELQPSD